MTLKEHLAISSACFQVPDNVSCKRQGKKTSTCSKPDKTIASPFGKESCLKRKGNYKEVLKTKRNKKTTALRPNIYFCQSQIKQFCKISETIEQGSPSQMPVGRGTDMRECSRCKKKNHRRKYGQLWRKCTPPARRAAALPAGSGLRLKPPRWGECRCPPLLRSAETQSARATPITRETRAEPA